MVNNSVLNYIGKQPHCILISGIQVPGRVWAWVIGRRVVLVLSGTILNNPSASFLHLPCKIPK